MSRVRAPSLTPPGRSVPPLAPTQPLPLGGRSLACARQRSTIELPAADDGAESTDPTAGTDAAGLPPRPQRGSCVDVPEASDGRYAVYDAGFAVITREGDRLVLGEVQAAEGWTARVDDDEGDEVEIDFRRDGDDVLDLEVEIEGGGVEAKICADDD